MKGGFRIGGMCQGRCHLRHRRPYYHMYREITIEPYEYRITSNIISPFTNLFIEKFHTYI